MASTAYLYPPEKSYFGMLLPMTPPVVETMAESSTTRSRDVMPGTFEPDDDLIDLRDNHFEILAAIQESWRQKDHSGPWSVHKLPVLDLEGVDWQTYAPPVALRKAPNVTSLILLDLVSKSIENIMTQASEEVRQKQEEEEKRAGAARPSKISLDDGEPYLPIVIREERPPTPPPKPEIQPTSNVKSPSDISVHRAEAVKAELRSPSDKGRKLNLRRFFGRATEKGSGTPDSARLQANGRKFLGFVKAEEPRSTISWDPTTGQYKRVQLEPQTVSWEPVAGQPKRVQTNPQTVAWDPTTGQYKRVEAKSQAGKAPGPPVELV